MSLSIQFLGGVRTVTGSKFLLTNNKTKILIDFGMFRGENNITQRNYLDFEFNPSEISYLILTHAHIDHSGLIPKLTKKGFKGKILGTKPTKDLCKIMLADSAYVESMELEWKNRKRIRSGLPLLEPLYTIEDANKSIGFFEAVEYNKLIDLKNGVRVKFLDAGHILGSSLVEIYCKNNSKETKLVFSGDIGSRGQEIICDPAKLSYADYLFIESTYGDRLHKSRKETIKEFESTIGSAKRDKGNIIIPAFAVERTQEIVYELSKLYRSGKLNGFTVYMDSPLAISATEIFQNNMNYFDMATKKMLKRGDNPFSFPILKYLKSQEDSKSLNRIKSNAIIISASGMCDGGRIKHHLKHNLWREECIVVFTGYQAAGTLGRAIVDGAKVVKIFGEEIAVKAKIYTLGGFSCHADRDELLKWVSNFKNKNMEVFVIHGEEKSSTSFASYVKDELKLKTYVPSLGEKVDL
ncbi:MAG: MBL fold metallo-hydrolase [Candidatus Firestonebacteria bacterium]